MESHLAGLPVNLVIGVVVFALVLLLLDNKRFPAALMAKPVGIASGLALGGFSGLKFSLGPTEMHIVGPTLADFWTAAIMLIIPQVTDHQQRLRRRPIPAARSSTATELRKAKAGRFAFSMGLMNLPAGLLGAVPMCHGTGGLAAHYRFGARTGGAPVMIGVFFVIIALLFGEFGFTLLSIIPQSVLGVLLVFAGLELCPLLRSLKTNEEYFVALLIAGIALAVPNMGWAFGVGIAVDFYIRKFKVKI